MSPREAVGCYHAEIADQLPNYMPQMTVFGANNVLVLLTKQPRLVSANGSE